MRRIAGETLNPEVSRKPQKKVDLEVSIMVKVKKCLVIIRTRPLLQNEEQEKKGRIFCVKRN